MTILSATSNWWHGLPRAVKVVGYVGVVAGAVVSGAQAVPVVEPYWYAHRGYVRAYSAPASDHAWLIKIQIKQDRDERQQLIDEAGKRALELQSNLAKQAPEYRALVQDRVNRVSEKLKQMEEDDNNLFREQKAK